MANYPFTKIRCESKLVSGVYDDDIIIESTGNKDEKIDLNFNEWYEIDLVTAGNNTVNIQKQSPGSSYKHIEDDSSGKRFGIVRLSIGNYTRWIVTLTGIGTADERIGRDGEIPINFEVRKVYLKRSASKIMIAYIN